MKQITVLKNFGGKETNERRILPGVYDVNAPELFGLADYLVENGHAVAVKTEAVPVKEATKAVEIQTVSIEVPTPEETGVEPKEVEKPKSPKGK